MMMMIVIVENWFACAVSDALDARKNPILINNTFVQQWERDQYIKLVSKHDCMMHEACMKY